MTARSRLRTAPEPARAAGSAPASARCSLLSPSRRRWRCARRSGRRSKRLQPSRPGPNARRRRPRRRRRHVHAAQRPARAHHRNRLARGVLRQARLRQQTRSRTAPSPPPSRNPGHAPPRCDPAKPRPLRPSPTLRRHRPHARHRARDDPLRLGRRLSVRLPATPARPATASPRTPRAPGTAAAGPPATRCRRRTPTRAGRPELAPRARRARGAHLPSQSIYEPARIDRRAPPTHEPRDRPQAAAALRHSSPAAVAHRSPVRFPRTRPRPQRLPARRTPWHHRCNWYTECSAGPLGARRAKPADYLGQVRGGGLGELAFGAWRRIGCVAMRWPWAS